MTSSPRTHPDFGHSALFYRGIPEYLEGLNGFVAAGQASAQPIMVALPTEKLEMVRRSLGNRAGVEFVDMCGLGRNPARVIPAMIQFAQEQDGAVVRFISELHWPGRSESEQEEVARHDALLELAIESYPLRILCPLDLTAAPPGAVATAWRTHEEVIVEGSPTRSDRHHPWRDTNLGGAWPLSSTPYEMIVGSLTFQALRGLRAIVDERASAAGLTGDRVQDAVLAVSEAASNSIQHGGGQGVMSIWREAPDALVFEIRDGGRIRDPLVGRCPPGPQLDAKGLWLVNQLADLVQIRSGEAGTVVRMSFRP